MSEVFHMPASAYGPSGEEDETAVLILSEDGVLIDSHVLGSIGLSWETLSRLVEHHYADERIFEAGVMRV